MKIGNSKLLFVWLALIVKISGMRVFDETYFEENYLVDISKEVLC